MRLIQPLLPLHPLQLGAMRGDIAAGLKSKSLAATHLVSKIVDA